ncbi:MAG: hypothetical protein ACRDUY_11545 [Nitriliruptorales bacterium]
MVIEHEQRQREVAMVFRSQVEADFIAATLAAHGIQAQAVTAFGYPSLDFVMGVKVVVAPELEEEARRLLRILGGEDPPGEFDADQPPN